MSGHLARRGAEPGVPARPASPHGGDWLNAWLLASGVPCRHAARTLRTRAPLPGSRTWAACCAPSWTSVIWGAR